MRMMRVMGIVTALVSLAASQVFAATCSELTQEEKAFWGATHVVNFTHADLTLTSTNGAPMTNSTALYVKGTDIVQFVAFELLTPFEYTSTNGLSSTTVKVGDGTDDDFFLTSTELNVNGSYIWYKFPPSDAYTVAMTYTTNNVTADGTNFGYFVTGGTAAATASALGRKVYTTADTVDFIFTPTGVNWSLNDLNKGAANFYFKIYHK